jgi:hypothetical protein
MVDPEAQFIRDPRGVDMHLPSKERANHTHRAAQLDGGLRSHAAAAFAQRLY